MDITHQLVSIFCEIDDHCKQLDTKFTDKLLESAKPRRGPKCGLSESEIMTILVFFQRVRLGDFKTFYLYHVQKHLKKYFPKLPSYNRFIELIPKVILQFTLFIQHKAAKAEGIFYIDSTSLPACNLRRSKRHKTFCETAGYGKTSVGWFFGLKLHLVVNDKAEIVSFKITSGNKSDSKEAESMLSKLKGLAFGDKGYLGKRLFEKLKESGLKLITRKRKNMKKVDKISDFEQQLLNQRGIIETVFGHLKHCYQIWHTRHRSIFNSMAHLLAGLAAYAIEPLKMNVIKKINNL